MGFIKGMKLVPAIYMDATTLTREVSKTAKPKWTKDKGYAAQALSLGDLTPIAILLVVVIVAVSLGAYIVSQIGGNFASNSVAANVTNNGQAALKEFSSWFVIIVVVVAAAIIIGLLLRSFYGGGGGERRV